MQMTPDFPRQALVSRPSTRRVIASPGARMALIVPPSETDGAWAFYESTLQQGAGAPPHTHSYTTELFYVLEGCLSATVGEATEVLGPGDALLVPPGVVHGFVNPALEPARVLSVAWPGTHADFLEGIAGVLNRTAPGDAARFAGLAALYAQYDQQPARGEPVPAPLPS